MYVLDTDTVSNFLDSRRQNPLLRSRILAQPPEALWISAITAEELLRGALQRIRDAQTRRRSPVAAYQLLVDLLRDLERVQILRYTDDAERIYLALPTEIRRRGPNDCRIAACALSAGYAVVTMNTGHFAGTPGLDVVDWSR